MGFWNKVKRGLSRENINKVESGIEHTSAVIGKVDEMSDKAMVIRDRLGQVIAPSKDVMGDYIEVQRNNQSHKENMATILSSHHEKMYQIDKKYEQQNKSLDKSFDVIDKGLESNNIALVAEGLKSSTHIAVSNPFDKELEALERAIDDPDEIIEL